MARKGWAGSLPAKLLPGENRDLSGNMGGGAGKRVVGSGATVVPEKAAATEALHASLMVLKLLIKNRASISESGGYWSNFRSDQIRWFVPSWK